METPTEVEGNVCRKRQNEIIQPLLTGTFHYYVKLIQNSIAKQCTEANLTASFVFRSVPAYHGLRVLEIGES